MARSERDKDRDGGSNYFAWVWPGISALIIILLMYLGLIVLCLIFPWGCYV